MRKEKTCNHLLNRISDGDINALSRLITIVETESLFAKQIMEKIEKQCLRKIPIVGITGPPGVGKSTLINQLIKTMKKNFSKIGILAVDPSSPISGGAILGDRIRMQEHVLDQNIFIRSVCTKGKLGGLSKTINNIVKLYNASDFDLIIIETAGVGQSELDIVKIADVTVVVIVPESGDDIQAMKSGLMEVGDIYVINKCDREGAEKIASELKRNIYQQQSRQRISPVTLVNSQTGEGVNELARNLTIKLHNKKDLLENKETQRQHDELLQLIMDEAEKRIKKELEKTYAKELIENINKGKYNIYEASEKITSHLFRDK